MPDTTTRSRAEAPAMASAITRGQAPKDGLSGFDDGSQARGLDTMRKFSSMVNRCFCFSFSSPVSLYRTSYALSTQIDNEVFPS